ncbi:N5-carboxyaminoimidazole ribonucleotide synthase [Candidatus Providencia siddallii]|uniref:N5-carboxyaminoimidazole ribonucleotide synthase n=1 Tax=Candidatus Providencia siddallii TaxID=1715285 RepID=A0A0M6W8B3_9GAMM|nr:N5-carboxyaminoimidazole ribonucleotide synthase [Candidatus Providencia siddallii]
MKPVYVLGNGQLGRMLRQAGEPLGIQVFPIGLNDNNENISFQKGIITAEIEHWPKTALTNKLSKHKSFINRDIFPRISDRFSQKKIFDSLKLANAKWDLLKSPEQFNNMFEIFGNNLIIKHRIGGYDGRNQLHLHKKDKTIIPYEFYGKCIVEEKIKFDEEISIIGARDKTGKSVFYPIIHNLHKNGILRASIVFPKRKNNLQNKAQNMLNIIMNKLNYIGVMAMEFFVVNNDLLINEISPRVHNSGHWTQNGASTNQFELHLRAILELPIHTPEVNNPAILINLIGTNINIDWLSLQFIHFHWYYKEVKYNRKVGHLNISHKNFKILIFTLNSLINILPDTYKDIIEWIKNKLKGYFT